MNRGLAAWPIAWRMTFYLTGLPYAVISLIMVWAGVAVAFADPAARSSFRLAELVIPFLGAVQGAFLFAPSDEHALEVMLAAPRPARWLIGERAAALLMMQGAVGLTASAVMALLPGGADLMSAILRWLPPLIALSGIAGYVSFLFGRSSFGLLTAILLFGVTLIGGDAIAASWQIWQAGGAFSLTALLWPVHLFLPAETAGVAAYGINRAVLMAIGLLALLQMMRLIERPERILALARED